ncbi:MAG: HEAT repeat domain-containing protein [Planctomycetota bacterium]
MNKTILIIIGIACAVISAAGIMWYNNPVNVARRQLYDTNPQVRCMAIKTLGNLHNKASVPEIAKLLQDNDLMVHYMHFLGRLPQDLNLVVAPFYLVLDIDDINVPSLPAPEISKIADFLRAKNWSTYLGIKPDCLNYLEPEFIEKARHDAETKKQLELEAEQVKTILENRDVFIPVLHAHGGTRWLAPTEKEQSEPYLNLLEKLRRYGFQIKEDSFGYMYFPNNKLNKITVDYLPKIGVHIARVCHDSFPEFKNRYYQLGDLTILPSACPIGPARKSVVEFDRYNMGPLEYLVAIRWFFVEGIFSREILFLHGNNFADGSLGIKALQDIASLVEGSRVIIYGQPFDLRDKYVSPFKILSQKEDSDKIILTFDRELTGQKLISTTYPLKRVVNDRNEDMILFDPHIFCGVGRKLELHHGLSNPGPVPRLKKVSNNAFLRYAIYKNGRITIELEGYGDTEISLTNLAISSFYLITNKCLQDEKLSTFTKTTSDKGELNFHLAISSYNSVEITAKCGEKGD